MSINFAEIKDIKARRRAFVEDEAAFYNSKNRAVVDMGDGCIRCVYTPTETSPGCAIGRHLDRNSVVICEGVTGGIESLLGGVYREEVVNSFPLWMREMGVEFLGDCQGLHDRSWLWNENGLSQEGKNCLNLILEKYC